MSTCTRKNGEISGLDFSVSVQNPVGMKEWGTATIMRKHLVGKPTEGDHCIVSVIMGRERWGKGGATGLLKPETPAEEKAQHSSTLNRGEKRLVNRGRGKGTGESPCYY